METGPEVCANVWYAGHVATGVEIERQFAAVREACSEGASVRLTILDAFARIPDCRPTALITVPSTTTWARGRHASPLGPKPLRDVRWPWGLPWLAPQEQQGVETANAEFRQIMKIITAVLARAPEAHILLLHPEQLGPARRGSPATIWDISELKRWSTRTGMMRAATYQCTYGPSDYRLPIGVLSSHCLNNKLFHRGWPKIGGNPLRYSGPLPMHCNCGRRAHKPRLATNARIAHRADTSLLKEDFIQYIADVLIRHARSLRAAELLRPGEEVDLQVRGEIHDVVDSSDEQSTWVPTESEQTAYEPSSIDNGLTDICWDRELADILSLGGMSPATDQTSSFANYLQHNLYDQHQNLPDVPVADDKATRP
jgi:hypothetical protein